MIVNYCNSGWEIITQRAHGLLAGQICARWKISDQPSRWVETLIATTEHDDVFNEFSRGPLLCGNGGPLDFKMTSFDITACREMMDKALSKSRFIALLFARHISFTHGSEGAAKRYLAGLKKLEGQWIKEARSSIAEVDRAYSLLEFCDAFSLLICQDQIPPEERRLEISQGPSGNSFQFFQQGQRLVVEPWPFEPDRFEVDYERLSLKEISFENDKVFRKALRKAAVEHRTVIICRE
ncbi:DUF3891 family protein [Pedobacter jeongneungensis]|uniref:DUF3891 family protein n=1 Tax=Pedobacter jeongneungensis TaxID=947309 RepID=UPI0004686A11|nr:DUF3891 family protein [Pedobacter jeongneungensis]